MFSDQEAAHNLGTDFYKKIFNFSPEAIVVINRSGHIIQINNRVQEWLGYTKDELLDKHLLQLPFLSLTTKELLIKNFLLRIAGKSVKEYSAEFITKSKEKKIGKIRGALLRDDENHVIADLVMITEETEEYYQEVARKKKEEILEAVSYSAKYFLKSKASQQDFEKVLESIGESVQSDRVALVINDLMGQKYEWVKEGQTTVIKKDEFPNFFKKSPQTAPIAEKLSENKTISGRITDFDEIALTTLAQLQVKSFVIVPITVESKWWAYLCVQDCSMEREWLGEEIDSLVIAAEIIGAAIEKNHVEIKLRETVEYWKHEKDRVSEEIQNTKKFKQAVESATDGVVITTVDPKIVYVNPAWEKMTGYTLEEVLDKDPNILNKDKTPADLFKQMWDSLSKGQSFISDEVVNTRKDGTDFPVRLTVFPIQEDLHNKFFVGLFEDITKRREIDQMKTEFISIASHQLNTPLSAMKWFLELLQNGKAGPLSSKQLEFVQNLVDSNQRMISLVRSLLNISRIESGRIIIDPQPTDVKLLIDEVLKDVILQIEKKKQSVHIDVIPALPKVNLDPRLIRHVIMNLLTNASKYSPDETVISIHVELDHEDVIVQVKDQGYGIPKQDQGKIFTKFFRAPNVLRMESDGSGLGMYLVKIVIESSGGKVWFTSEENKGTEINFSLPIKGIKPKAGDVFLDLNKVS